MGGSDDRLGGPGDLLPLSVEEHHHGAERRLHSGDRIADRDAHAHGWAVGVADEFAEARIAFGHGGESGARRHRSGLAERGDAHEDEVGVGLFEHVGAESPLLEGAGAEVLEQDVAAADEFEHGLAPLVAAQVEHDRLLVAVDRAVEHRGVAGFEPPVAQFVAGAGAFDLDHLGAEITEDLPGPGSGEHARQIEDADMG